MTQWTLAIPYPPITANARGNRWDDARRVRNIRQAVATLARSQRIPDLTGHCDVQLEVRFITNRRRDATNWMPTEKAAVDGLRDAGVLADDTQAHYTAHIPIVRMETDPRLVNQMRTFISQSLAYLIITDTKGET